jgi:raffinose/stachyose/melibiose transport system permease protein
VANPIQSAKRLAALRRFGIFALIPLAVFTVVLVVPFIGGIFYTFTDWNGFE